MSIVTLKRKGQILHTLSGKSPNTVMVIRGPNQNMPLSQGGGFSLNGKERNIGYIGKTYAKSSGGTKMKAGTIDWKGNGGNYGSYIINPSVNNQCCVSDVGVKPTVLNTKGMLSQKYRWRKQNIPDEIFTNVGYPVPKKNQIQKIYNRWVSTNVQQSSDRTRDLARVLTFNNPPKNTKMAAVKCQTQHHHVGSNVVVGVELPTFERSQPYNRYLNKIGSANRALSNVVSRRATPFPKGYDRPFPPHPSSVGCVHSSQQAYDTPTLETYYYDKNDTTIINCNN